jgi:hypothetical protein
VLYLAHKYLSQAAVAVAATTAASAAAAGEGDACAQAQPPRAGVSGPATPQTPPPPPHLRGGGAGGASSSTTTSTTLDKADAGSAQPQKQHQQHQSWATDTPAGAALRAALLSNANLCGDNANRGMLLGALMGAAVGGRNIPADLVGGLYRADALAAVIDALADGVARSFQTAAAAGRRGGGGAQLQPLRPRFGRPRPLPLLRYVAADSSAAATAVVGDGVGAFTAPRDFRGKLAAVAADAARAGVPGSRLRYVRGAGPVVLPPATSPLAHADANVDALLARVLPPMKTAAGADAAAAAAASLPAIDAGDAAADRAAALAALAGGGNGSGGGAAPAAAAAEAPSSSASAAPPTSVRLAELDAALLDSDSATNTLLAAVAAAGEDDSSDASLRAVTAAHRLLRVDCAPGTGVFVYRHPADLLRRT